MNKKNFSRNLLISALALGMAACAPLVRHQAAATPPAPAPSAVAAVDDGADGSAGDPLFSVPDPDQPDPARPSDAAPAQGTDAALAPSPEALSAAADPLPPEEYLIQSLLDRYAPPLPPQQADRITPVPDTDGPGGTAAATNGEDGQTDDSADADAGAATDQDQADGAASDAAAQSDLWLRIRAGLRLSADDHDHAVAREAHWFATHQGYLDRVTERAKYYLYFIADEVQQRKLPMELALLPIVESAYQPFAYSHGRAAGIWQFIPSTARLYGLKRNWWYDGRRDVVASTRAALDYLQTLADHFDGDWLLALAAYNSGEGTVEHAIRHNKRRGRPTDFWALPLPVETRVYVPRLLAIASIVGDPSHFGVTLAPIPDEPYFTAVDVGSQIDLALVAKLTDMPLDEVYRLNPGFNRWATAPKGPHKVLVPADKAETFREGLAALSPDERVHWIRHKVTRGETLSDIAVRYHTSMGLIRQVNSLRGNMIRAGHYLTVPVALKRPRSYTLSVAQRTRAVKNTPRGRNRIEHQVVPGDTLWDLSRTYHVSVRQLAAWNGMAPGDTLRPGQHLVIWSNNRHLLGTLRKSMLAGPGSELATRRITYRVRRGDSLARISQHFNVSVSDLQEWNKVSTEDYLQPGQKLVLFVDVTQIGDNI